MALRNCLFFLTLKDFLGFSAWCVLVGLRDSSDNYS